jgi:hypothetical protein
VLDNAVVEQAHATLSMGHVVAMVRTPLPVVFAVPVGEALAPAEASAARWMVSPVVVQDRMEARRGVGVER